MWISIEWILEGEALTWVESKISLTAICSMFQLLAAHCVWGAASPDDDDKELERTLRARKMAFEHATRQAPTTGSKSIRRMPSHAGWRLMTTGRRTRIPDLSLKLEGEFSDYVADHIRKALTLPEVTRTPSSRCLASERCLV
jgi:hypothetical protein